jgi:ribose transport system substrate-binding protein
MRTQPRPTGGRRRSAAPLVSVAVAAIAALSLIACGGVEGPGDSDSESTSTISEDADRPVRLAAFLQSTENTYFQADLEGIEAAAEQATGGEVTVEAFDGKFDSAAQVKQIEDANASGNYDAYVVMANDGAAVVPAVKEAIGQGIPVVAGYVPIGPDITESEPQVDGVVATVWHDEPADGKDLADATIKACQEEHPDADPCQVFEISGGNALPYEAAKLEEFKKAIGAADQNIELVAQQEGNFLRDDSRTAAQNMLQANPDVNVIATTGDQMTLGAEDAVKDAGLEGQVTLLGDGASVQGVEAVQNGRWFSTNAYLPFDEGKDSAEIAIDAARGIDPEQTSILLREQSPFGPIYYQSTDEPFDGQWSA